MYAVLRRLHYDETRLLSASAELNEFQRLHASQPGYQGSLSVDLGGGRRFVVNLWDTEAHATEGRNALIPVVRRLVEPLLSSPAELVGAGPVVENDLLRKP